MLASRLVLLFGIANAILYSSLLPMFEGFDETFHYAFVQSLSTHRSLPVLGRDTVSEEIWQALQLQPVSHYIQASTGAPMNFSDYFRMTREQRVDMRRRLESLPSGEKYQAHSGLLNYEVNQPPIAYAVAAIPDSLMSGLSMTWRVFAIRLLLSITSAVLIYIGMRMLGTALSSPWWLAASFCVFCSQMLYATICHVCNDSLAVPAMIFFIWSAVRALQHPSRKTFAILAVMLSVALLTKVYFIFEVPLALALVAWHLWARKATLADVELFGAILMVITGPWLGRNAALYHNLTGTADKAAGFGPSQLLDSLARLPWRDSITYMATSSIWTGNNSFTTFSSRSLAVVLLLLAASAVLYVVHRKGWRTPEGVTLTAILLFCGGLLYITLAFFYASKGAVNAAMPWYMQVLLPPVMLLAFLSMTRSGMIGRALAIGALLAWTYLIGATYLMKLIPLYGGFTGARAHVPELWSWYVHQGAERSAILGTMCLTPAWWIYAWTATVLLLAFTVCAILIRGISTPASTARGQYRAPEVS